MIKVALDTSPLKNGNAHRGVGAYTKFLSAELKKIPELEIFEGDADQFTNHKVDLVHYPFFDLFFSTLPIFHRLKRVVTIHDVIPLLFPKAYPTGIKGKVRFLHQWLALRFTSAIITDSAASKADIIKYLSIPADKISVVFLAPNPNLAPVAANTITNVKHKNHLPAKYILYVGDINYNKNLPQLIKSLKYLPDDIKLVLVGRNFFPQPIKEWEEIELQLAISNVTDRVIFLDKLGSDAEKELAALYAGAVCYVQPSLAEGFGLPVTEAMACGTPVVASNNSSLPEVGGDSVTYVEPDAESIANGIKVILLNTATQNDEIIKKGSMWVAQYSWTRTAEETAAVYKKILRVLN